MWKSPWITRIAWMVFAVAFYVGVAAHWWVPRIPAG